jgi:hypothetical protein
MGQNAAPTNKARAHSIVTLPGLFHLPAEIQRAGQHAGRLGPLRGLGPTDPDLAPSPVFWRPLPARGMGLETNGMTR